MPALRRLTRKGQRGMALLLALTVITILIGVTVEAHRRVRNLMTAANAASERQRLDFLAGSGIQAGMALLLEDKAKNETDSIQEDWARPEKRDELLAQLGVAPGSLTLDITDLTGLIQVNALAVQPDGKDFVKAQAELWDRFLRPVVSLQETADLNLTTDIINCLKDWLDRNDDDAVTGLNGAESDFYEGLDPSYKARNGPMRDIYEILLVKGMTPEIFYGTEKLPGIAPYVTTFGALSTGSGDSRTVEYPGHINISTAPLPVLKALLPVENSDLAESLIAYREMKESDTYVNDVSQLTWYKNAPGCADLAIDQSLVSVSSDLFEISATGRGENMTARVTAVVAREKDAEGKYSCRVLAWR